MFPRRDSRLLSWPIALGVGAFVTVNPACKSTEHHTSSDSGKPTSSNEGKPVVTPVSTDDPKAAAALESLYVIGPAAARDMDYRVAWHYGQPSNQPLRMFRVEGDSVFTLDKKNLLTRVRREDGNRLWHLTTAAEVEEILGLNYIKDKVYLTSGDSVLVLDAGNGALAGVQKLDKIADTQPVVFNQYLIYGARNGQMIWHSYPVGFMSRGFQIAPSIQIDPVLVDNFLIGVGSNGTIMVLNPSDARSYWGTKLLSNVVAKPAAGNGALYVAGLDQHIRAFDLGTGRTLWKKITESPLTESPTLIGDRVYQQIPNEGLVAFEALPADSPGGKVVWKAPNVHGDVIMQRRENLYVWEAKTHQLLLVENGHGNVVRTVSLPHVKVLLPMPAEKGTDAGDIFAAGEDCRIVRLVPR
jgi:hypothetical protein